MTDGKQLHFARVSIGLQSTKINCSDDYNERIEDGFVEVSEKELYALWDLSIESKAHFPDMLLTYNDIKTQRDELRAACGEAERALLWYLKEDDKVLAQLKAAIDQAKESE